MIVILEGADVILADRYGEKIRTLTRHDDPVGSGAPVDGDGKDDQRRRGRAGRRRDSAAHIAVAVEDAQVLAQRAELAAGERREAAQPNRHTAGARLHGVHLRQAGLRRCDVRTGSREVRGQPRSESDTRAAYALRAQNAPTTRMLAYAAGS